MNPTTTKTMTLQLARTIMLTGTDFVLRRQIWNSKKGLTMDEPLTSIELGPIERSCGDVELTTLSDLVTYTQPRRIVSCSGNVIQSFEATSHASASQPGTISASSELEARVSQNNLHGGEIWAAVQRSPGQWPASWDKDENSTSLLTSLLNANIRLYRVQSGGGGWEGRGGPVTLEEGDTSKPSEPVADSEDPESYFSRLEQYLSGADSVVKPGDIVQFLCVQKTSSPVVRPVKCRQRRRSEVVCEPDFLLGTMPLPGNRGPPLTITHNPLLLGSFCVLSESAEYTVQAIPSQIDHGAAPLGRLFSTTLPPLTNFMRTRGELTKARAARLTRWSNPDIGRVKQK